MRLLGIDYSAASKKTQTQDDFAEWRVETPVHYPRGLKTPVSKRTCVFCPSRWKQLNATIDDCELCRRKNVSRLLVSFSDLRCEISVDVDCGCVCTYFPYAEDFIIFTEPEEQMQRVVHILVVMVVWFSQILVHEDH